MCPSASFEAEVLRINGRYNAEIIEALDLCPYAAPARQGGTSVRRVLWEPTLSVAALVQVADRLATDPDLEVAQVILPLVRVTAGEMLSFGQAFGEANAQRAREAYDAAEGRRPNRRPTFVHAVFHPDLPYKTDTPAQLVPFFRRSPDPFVQLVRLTVLDEIHARRPRGTQFFDGSLEDLSRLLAEKPVKSVTDLITDENHRRATEEGALAQISAVFRDIVEDRDRSYAAFLPPAEVP
jgi:hypothetical protein